MTIISDSLPDIYSPENIDADNRFTVAFLREHPEVQELQPAWADTIWVDEMDDPSTARLVFERHFGLDADLAVGANYDVETGNMHFDRQVTVGLPQTRSIGDGLVVIREMRDALAMETTHTFTLCVATGVDIEQALPLARRLAAVIEEEGYEPIEWFAFMEVLATVKDPIRQAFARELNS